MEREVEHEPRGLGTQALTAAFADLDAELGAPVCVHDREQTSRTDGRRVAAVIDRELDRFGLALGASLKVVVHPLLLALRGGDALVVQAAPDLELVPPARIGRGQIAPQRS